METKSWYSSLTIWGGIINMVALILEITGIVKLSPEEQASLTQTLTTFGTIVGQTIGVVMVIIGRIRATKKIGSGGAK